MVNVIVFVYRVTLLVGIPMYSTTPCRPGDDVARYDTRLQLTGHRATGPASPQARYGYRIAPTRPASGRDTTRGKPGRMSCGPMAAGPERG